VSKPFFASFMAAAVQRKAIEDELQRFTLRVTRRTVPIIFSMMLVHAADSCPSQTVRYLTLQIIFTAASPAVTRSCGDNKCRKRHIERPAARAESDAQSRAQPRRQTALRLEGHDIPYTVTPGNAPTVGIA
jgi:hypothetical protein